MNEPLELLCYLHPGWDPQIRPAPTTRDWMDATPEKFAYRCLPLNIANAHGWVVPCPCDVVATWSGGAATTDVAIRAAPGTPPYAVPVSIFGQGVLTFHIEGLIRTPPGWNLWVGGAPNQLKDAIQPLTGVVETDWSPYTFTMNWRFTRPRHCVVFRKGEPICFFFPVQRGLLEAMEPRYVPLPAVPEVAAQFEAWSASRNAFQGEMASNPPRDPADKWQKRYYRGVDMREQVAPGHHTKLRLKPFARPAG